MIPKKPAPDLIRGGNRFPAFAKPASAGEARSGKDHAVTQNPHHDADFTLIGSWRSSGQGMVAGKCYNPKRQQGMRHAGFE
jgi:hypothetical protein